MNTVKVRYSEGIGDDHPLPEYVTIIFTLPNGHEIRCRLREDEGDAYVDVYGNSNDMKTLTITPWASNRIHVR